MSDLVISDIGDVLAPGSDTLDVITLTEAKAALNIASTDTSRDAELDSYITAVSRRLDELCGAIVIRTVTDEQHPGGTGVIFLNQAPVSSSSATTITTVTEYTGGTAQVLTAESLTAASATSYYFDQGAGILYRRSSWEPYTFGTVLVTYEAGRYADTSSVDAKFKESAKIMLSHLWQSEKGIGGSATFGVPTDQSDIEAPHYGLMAKQVRILLEGEIKPPSVG